MTILCAVTGPRAIGAFCFSLCLVGARVGHAEGEATRIVARVGVAVPVWNHALYDAGALAQGGLDLPLRGGETHRLRILGQWMGFGTAGARADVAALQASWRLYPSRGGLFLEFGAGALVEVERLRLSLPTRAVDESKTRPGIPASVTVGFGLWRTIELEGSYQQIVFFRDEPSAIGVAHFSIGGRL